MSTIHASNFGDGTNTVESSYVLNGTLKQWSFIINSGTPSVGDSLNVSSLTDNGVGIIQINLTNSYLNAFYTMTSTASGNARNNTVFGRETTSNYSIYTYQIYNINGSVDTDFCSESVGDLA